MIQVLLMSAQWAGLIVIVCISFLFCLWLVDQTIFILLKYLGAWSDFIDFVRSKKNNDHNI